MMFIVGLIIGANIGMILTAIIKVNRKTCLHCAMNNAYYCENCHQNLMSEILKRQLNNKFGVNGYVDTDSVDIHVPHLD